MRKLIAAENEQPKIIRASYEELAQRLNMIQSALKKV